MAKASVGVVKLDLVPNNVYSIQDTDRNAHSAVDEAPWPPIQNYHMCNYFHSIVAKFEPDFIPEPKYSRLKSGDRLNAPKALRKFLWMTVFPPFPVKI